MSVLVYRGELPRTRLDKLQRYKLGNILKEEQGARSREHEAKPEPDFEEYLLLKRFIEAEKGIKVHAADHIETDLALDSLDKISLQTFIENTFGTSLGIDEMPGFPNIEALAQHIAKNKQNSDSSLLTLQSPDWHQLLHAPVDNLPLPKAGLSYRIVSRILKGFFCIYNGLKINGKENVPKQGACILAPNHQSYADAPLVLAGLSWNMLKDYYFYATEEHVRSDYRKRMAAKSNVIVMERSDLKNSILKLAKVLREGHRVIIFPEGARTHDGQTIPFKKTFAILAKELGVPIIPVCISGAFEALPRGHSFMRPKHIEVSFLPAIKGTKGKEQAEDLSYENLTRQAQNAIEEVLAKKN